MKRTLRILSLFLLSASLFPTLCLPFPEKRSTETERSEKKSGSLKEWKEGPVRYLLTRAEEDLFKSLQTEKERAAFINKFWSRRDPTPGTPANEFRYNFWQRVIDSNFLFAESTKPGWKTDRGKVYVIMGPPQDVEESLTMESSGSSSPGKNFSVLQWTYQGTGRTDLAPVVVVAFEKGSEGEYRLSRDPLLNSVFYDLAGSYARPLFDNETKRFRQTSVSELAVTLDLGRMQELPPEAEVLAAIITDKEYFGAIPLKAITAFYPTELPGKVLLSLTITIRKTDLPGPRESSDDASKVFLVARLIGAGDEVIAYDFPEGSFAPGPFNEREDDPFLCYQLKSAVSPGRYKLLVGIFDGRSEYIGSFHEMTEIPPFQGKEFSLSSLTLARHLEQKEGGSKEEAMEPFRFGDFFVVPRNDQKFRNGDFFAVFFQIFFPPDPGPPSGDQEPKEVQLKGDYQFSRKDARGKYLPIGKPIPFDITQPVPALPLTVNRGWSFDIKNWPPGDFQFLVTVRIEKTGETLSREILFSVE